MSIISMAINQIIGAARVSLESVVAEALGSPLGTCI
jgi:hypothetical protein